jgi:hypothetical protein
LRMDLGGLYLVAGKDQISNFVEGYELVVELWMYMNWRNK